MQFKCLNRNCKIQKFICMVLALLFLWAVLFVPFFSAPIIAASTATTTTSVNLRSGPGTSYNIVTVLSQGSTVTVLDSSNSEWIRVKTGDGKEGYCSADYLSVAQATTTSGSVETATVKEGLNIRSGPGFSYGVISVLGQGSKVTVLDKSNTSWIKVQASNGIQGYCSAEYLSFSSAGTSTGTSSTTSLGTATTTDNLNLRSGAGSTYSVIRVLLKGTTVTVLDKSNPSWIKVQTSDGKQGYCSSEYLNLSTTSSGSSSGSNTSSSSSNAKGTLTLDTRSYTMAPGGIYDFRAKLSGTGLNQEDLKVYSSRDGIAKVERISGTDKYRITGLKEGTCYIMAEIYGVHASIKVTIQNGVSPSGSSERSITQIGGDNTGGTSGNISITLDTKKYDFTAVGQVYQFIAKGIPSGSTPTVTSSNPSAVSVTLLSATDSRGYLYQIQSVGVGGSTITVSVGNASASMPVTVAGSSEGDTSSQGTISLDTKSYSFSGTGQSYQFLVKGVPAGSTPVVKSSDSSIVTVSLVNANDSRGYLYEIRSVSPGSVTITVNVGTASTASMPVTVADNTDDDTDFDNPFDNDTDNSSDTNDGENNPSYSYAKTTTAVNLRSGPGTNYSKLTTLATGTVVTVLDTSNSEWTKVRTDSGTEGYLSTDYIQFTNSPNTSTTTGISLSHTSGSIPQGMTYYIKATVNPSGNTVTWSSSNSNVATVSNGYIYAVSPGTAVITASSGGYSAVCNITVTEANPVKTAYTSPNIAGVGSTVELVAVTDDQRDGVRFVIDMNDGTSTTLDCYDYTAENSTSSGLAENRTRVWRTSISFSKTGTYKIKVYSYKNGTLSSEGVSTDSFVVSTQDFSTSTTEQRRVSDQMLEIMCKWEGYSAAVYPDQLAYGIPTIGYGQTYSSGAKFYNNITKTEAWSLLLNTVNASYTSAVNTFITNNNLRVNQNQFDAMVSFSHNVGSGYWNGTSEFDIREVLLNAVVPPNVNGQNLSATTTFSTTIYSSANIGAATITEIMKGASIQVMSTTWDSANRIGWYQIIAPDGTQGWVKSGDVRFNSSVSVVHDLNYTDSQTLATKWLAWHHAGGNCIPGLVYRRLGEAKIFSYGNYAEANPSSSQYRHNTYGYEYPSCAKQYEQ